MNVLPLNTYTPFVSLLDRFDNIRINGGIPELAALGDYGDALQTVSEQIIEHTKLSPRKAISALG